MKNLNFYIQDGLIGQHDPKTDNWDFGDCSQRMGDYHFWQYFEAPEPYWIILEDTVSKLEVSPGVWRRHPDQYNQPEDYSRDQQLSMQCALAVHDKTAVLKRMIYTQWKHFGLYQNKDFRTWEWAIDFRCLKMWWMYPLICVLDIGLLINVIIRLIIGGLNADNVGDDINLTISTIFCNYRYPSPISWLAWKIYSLRDVQRAWDWYFRQDESPPLNELFRPLIRKWF